MPMKLEYEKLLTEHDRTISMLRKQWMEADPKDQMKYMERINAAPTTRDHAP